MDNQTQQLFSFNPGASLPSGSIERSFDIPGPTIVNLQNVQNFSNVCRACATITEFIMPIFSGEGLQYNLAEKINKHMPIKVSETDLLPHVLCYQCASQLLAWHELIQCCQQADVALRSKIAADTRTDPATKDPKPTNSISDPRVPEDAKSQAYTETKIEGKDAESGKTTSRLEPAANIVTVEADGRRTAWCELCNKSVSVVSRRRHLRLHDGERRYSCHTCGRAFADSGNLARHVRTLHARERPFTCPACRKTFTRRAHLDDHVKSHSEKREFVCDSCGKASKSQAALRMHRRTHAARTLPCVQCGAAFRRRADLRAHASVHSGERAHACACGRAFRLRAQLNAHARTQHPAVD